MPKYHLVCAVTNRGSLIGRVFKTAEAMEEHLRAQEPWKQAIAFVMDGDVDMLTYNGTKWESHLDLIESLYE